MTDNATTQPTLFDRITPFNMATPFVGNIEELTLANNNFRDVVNTAKHSQLVLMSLDPNEDIGEETHANVDQFFRIEQGVGVAFINDVSHSIKDGDAIVIPAGTKHNIINASGIQPLKLYTIYSPPNHKAGTVHVTKEDALADKDDIPETV